MVRRASTKESQTEFGIMSVNSPAAVLATAGMFCTPDGWHRQPLEQFRSPPVEYLVGMNTTSSRCDLDSFDQR